MDCGSTNNWRQETPYTTWDLLWTTHGSYVIRAPGGGTASSSSSSTSKQKVIQRGEIATKYDENAKLENIIEEDKTTYIFNNEVWINFVYKNALKMKETTLSDLLKNFDTEDTIFENQLVKSGEIIDITKLVNEGKIVPGDILYAADGKGGGEYLLYVGGTKILYAAPTYEEEPTNEEESSDDPTSSAIRYEYLQYYLEDLKTDLLREHEDEEDYELPPYGVTKIYRLKESYAKNLTQKDTTMIFNKKGYFTYDKYEGTPPQNSVTLNATQEESGFKWIFDGIAGLFELLLNTILYVVRMIILGWVNVIELQLQSVILGLSGNANLQMIANFFGPDATTANGSRISVESIFFNQIPILDANFFNFESAGGYSLTTTTMYQPATASGMGAYEITKPNESNIVYQLRKNLSTWYGIIRNASIAMLLLVLIGLGITYAISTTGEKKASIKNLLVSWLVAFIVVFFIHFFMYMVFEVNDTLVGVCRDLSQSFASASLDNQNPQELNIYDAVRVKAYSFSFREGIPATVLYIYLIYLLIRFSYIYFKRYITIYVLALLGSFMGVRYAYEKITGKKNTSLGKWFKDFAFNVLLQTVHAFIYVIYMGIALNSASESLAGFLLCVIILNFMINADKIIIKIFGLDKASSLADVAKAESYLQLVSKFTPIYTFYTNATKYLFGKHGLVKEIKYSLKGFDNYKDAEKYFENEKYNRIGKMQAFRDKLDAWVTDRGQSVHNMLRKIGFKGIKDFKGLNISGKYAKDRRLLNAAIPLEQKISIYNGIKKSKELNRKKFTRPLGLVRDLYLTPIAVMGTVALSIADPAAGMKAFQKTKKMISKHITISKSMRRHHVYKNRKIREKENYKKQKKAYNKSVIRYVDSKMDYENELKRLKNQYDTTKNPDYKEKYKAQMDKLEKDRLNEIKRMKKEIKSSVANGVEGTDDALIALQEQFKKMYSAKSDIRLDADLKKAENKFEELMNAYVKDQTNKQMKISELKNTLSTITNAIKRKELQDQITNLEKEQAKAEARGLDELKEAYVKVTEEKVLYKNAKYERNVLVKGIAALTGLSPLTDMAQSEITAMHNDSVSAAKEQKKLNELNKIASDTAEFEGLMKQIKDGYDGADETTTEAAYNKEMANLIKDASKTTVKSGVIKSVVSSYMNENNITKINGDNIDQVLDKLEKKLEKEGYQIIISDSLKKEVKKQLEEKLIEDKKGLGYNKNDATVAINSILGQEGMVETILKGSEVKDAVSKYMEDNHKNRVKSEDIDKMIDEVQESIRADLPNDVKNKIRNQIESELNHSENINGINKSLVSKIINKEIKDNKIEDRSRYHKSLTRAQVEELRSSGIAINTEKYYEYLAAHGIETKEIENEKARNRARQLARDINTRNENAKVKLGGSLVDVKKALYESY